MAEALRSAEAPRKAGTEPLDPLAAEFPDILMRKINAVKVLDYRREYIAERFPYDRTVGERQPPPVRDAGIAKFAALDRASHYYTTHGKIILLFCNPVQPKPKPAPSGFKKRAAAMFSRSKDARPVPKHEVCDSLDDEGVKRTLPSLPDKKKEDLKVVWDAEWPKTDAFKEMMSGYKDAFYKLQYELRKRHAKDPEIVKARQQTFVTLRGEIQRWIDNPDNGLKLQHVCFSRYFQDMEMMIYCNVLTNVKSPHLGKYMLYKGKKWTHEEWEERYLTPNDLAHLQIVKAQKRAERLAQYAEWDREAASGSAASRTAHSEYENYLFMDQFPENNDRGDEDLYQQNDVWRIDANERVLPPFKPHHHLYAPSKPSTSGFDVVSMIFAMAIAFVAGMVICCICWLWTALTGYFVASVAKTKATKRDEDDEESQYAVH